MTRLRLRHWLLALVLFVGGTAYYLSYVEYGFNFADEGGFYYQAVRVREGQVSFLDFYGYPPLRDLLVGWALGWCEFNVLTMRQLVSVLSALAPPVVYLLICAAGSPYWAWWCAVAVLLTPCSYYHRMLSLLPVFVLPGLLWGWRRVTLPGWLAYGALSGLLLTARLDLGLAGVGLLLAYQLLPPPQLESWGRRLTALAWQTAGFVAVSGVLGLGHLRRAGLATYWRNVWADLTLFQQHEIPLPDLWAWLRVPLAASLAEGLGRWASIGYVLLAASLLLAVTWSTKLVLTRSRRTQAFLVLATSLLLLAASLNISANPLYENIVRSYALMFLLFGLGLAETTRGLPALRGRVTAVVLPLLLLSFLAGHVLVSSKNLGGVALRDPSAVRLNLPRMPLKVHPALAAATEHTVAAIRSHTRPGDPIFCATFCPLLYFLTETRNPTRFDWVLRSFMHTPTVLQEVIADLERAQTRLVVLEDFVWHAKPEYSTAAIMAPFQDYLKRHYREAESFPPLTLYLRREQPSCGGLAEMRPRVLAGEATLPAEATEWLRRGEEWYPPERHPEGTHIWSRGREASLSVALGMADDYRAEAMMFSLPSIAPGTPLRLSIGTETFELPCPGNWSNVDLGTHAAPLGSPWELRLNWGRLFTPASVGWSSSTKRLGGAVRALRLLPSGEGTTPQARWTATGEALHVELPPGSTASLDGVLPSLGEGALLLTALSGEATVQFRQGESASEQRVQSQALRLSLTGESRWQLTLQPTDTETVIEVQGWVGCQGNRTTRRFGPALRGNTPRPQRGGWVRPTAGNVQRVKCL